VGVVWYVIFSKGFCQKFARKFEENCEFVVYFVVILSLSARVFIWLKIVSAFLFLYPAIVKNGDKNKLFTHH
jgi:hypothetical protein